MNKLRLASLLLVVLSLSSCGKKTALDDTDQETAQQVGDVMSSIDESGGDTGVIAALDPALDEDRILRGARPLFARHGASLSPRFSLLADARAASCATTTFSGCSGGTTRTRSLGGCTLGLATFSGSVTLTWGGAQSGCQISGVGGHISRVPSFTVTGLRSAQLSVGLASGATVGQRVTFTGLSGSSPAYTYTNDGIRRTFTFAGVTLFDFTAQTASDITIVGASRSARVVNGGSLQTTNHLTGEICLFTPSAVAWSGGCNCPTSGSWSASCTDGRSGTLKITGCGTATYETDTREGSVTFDRCYGT